MTKTKKKYHSVKEQKRVKRIAVLSTAIALFVAALAMVFGFAIAEGWQVVFAWFTSKWATLCVVTFLITMMALLYAFFAMQDGKDFR